MYKQPVDKQPLRGETIIYKYGINLEFVILNDGYFLKFELEVKKEIDRK